MTPKSENELYSGSTDYPINWALVSFDDVIDEMRNGTTSKQNKNGLGVPVTRIETIADGLVNLNKTGFIVDATSELIEKYRLHEGDILFSHINSASHLGKTALIAELSGTLLHGMNLMLIRMNRKAIEPAFFHKYCVYKRSEGEFSLIAQHAVNQASINQKKLKAFPILVPPKNEQTRIVTAIESLQQRSARARALLTEVEPLIQTLRQSILQSAFSGRLTADWRAKNPDVESASQLLDRIRTERRQRWETDQLANFEAKGKKPPKNWKDKYKQPEPVDDSELEALPESWAWCRVDDVGEVRLGRQRSPKYHSGPNMRPYLRVKNVYEDRIDVSDIMEMDFSDEEFERYKLLYGDILLNEGQSFELVGRPAIYRDELPNSCFTNTLVRFRSIKELSFEYPQIVFLGYLKSSRFQRIASRTVNIAHLGASRFAAMEFPLPPAEERAEIVRLATGALRSIERSKKIFLQMGLELGKLDQSILSKAFCGELVPQDPNDEPASELLARIRAAREAEIPKKKKASSKKKAKKKK